MIKNRYVIVIIFLLLCSVLFPESVFSQKSWKASLTFRIPGKMPGGITWDGHHIWIIDNSMMKIFKIDPKSGETIASIQSDIKNAKALAWDGVHLWILDDETKSLYSISPENGQILKKFAVSGPAGKGSWSLEGLTWDKGKLWVSYYAGYSSKILQINPESGKDMQSFYSDCNPRGLATDGDNLLTVCYNGTKLPSTIDTRHVSGNSYEMTKSRKFIGKLPITDIRGLAFDGKNFWTIDVRAMTLKRLSSEQQ